MRTCVLFLIFIVYQCQVVNFSAAAGVLNAKDVAPKEKTETGRKPRNIIDDLFSTVSGLFGGSSMAATTSPPALPPTIMYDDIIITPPPYPAADDPIYKPGTTNSGGVVQHLLATLSGFASGVFGAVGLNERGPVHTLGLFRPTPASFPLPQDIRSQIDSFKVGLNSVNPQGKYPSIPQTSISDYVPQSQQDGVGNVVSGIFEQAAECNGIRKLLGQC